MELAVYGSKGGYKTFSETQGGKAFSSEFRANASNDITRPAIGESFYGIGSKDDFRVFSKFYIVKDVDRNATGFLAFSVGINRNEKLSGTKTLSLLEDLSSEYRQKYHIGNELKSYAEDDEYNQGLFDRITKQYVSAIRSNDFPNSNPAERDNEERGFFYYNSNDEVSELFNDPDWSIFSSFEIVFLVKKSLKDRPENPLNALGHNPSADLTDKIDLQNLRYRLKFDQYTLQGAEIQCRINDQLTRSGDAFRKNDQLDILFKKKYYTDIPHSGSLDQLRGDCLEVDDMNRIAVVRRDISVVPLKKRICFDVRDENGNRISAAEITIKSDGKLENILEGSKEFSAEELGMTWKASAKKSEREYSDEITFTPLDTNEVSLIVKEHKRIHITVVGPKGNSIVNSRVLIEGKKPINGNEFEFIGQSEIRSRWKVSFSSSEEYENGVMNIEPSQRDTFELTLKKRKRYLIIPGEHGTLRNASYCYYETGLDADTIIKPNKGYKFKKLERVEQEANGFDGRLIAHYEKRKSPMKLILFILLGLILIAGGSIGGYYLMYGKIPFTNIFITSSELEDSVKKVFPKEDTTIEDNLPGTSQTDSTTTEQPEVYQEQSGEAKQESRKDSKREVNKEENKNSNSRSSQSPTTSPATTTTKIKDHVEASESKMFLQRDFTKQELEDYQFNRLSEEENRGVTMAKSFWNDYFSESDKTYIDYKAFLKKVESNSILKNSLLKQVVERLSKSAENVDKLRPIPKSNPIKLSEILRELKP